MTAVCCPGKWEPKHDPHDVYSLNVSFLWLQKSEEICWYKNPPPGRHGRHGLVTAGAMNW